jgi:DNA-cytosine methyltransferase
MMYYYLDLFSGIGGFALGAYWAGMKFHGHYFSEVDDYAIGIYKKRFPDAIPLGDVRNIKGESLPKGRWLITGGFPCQDISVAGTRAGLEGERSGLFSEYIRLIGEIRPSFAIMENVGNLASWFDAGEGRYPPSEAIVEGGEWPVEIDQYQGIARCIGSLSEIGYDSEWAVIRASDVGAPHRRDRFWIVGYPCGGGLPRIARGRPGAQSSDGHLQLETRDIFRDTNGLNEREKQAVWGRENAIPCGICSNVADPDSFRLEYKRKIPDGTGEQNISLQPERGCTTLANAGCPGIHQSGFSSDVSGNDGQQRRIYGNGLQGSEGKERIPLANPHVINDDLAGHGTGQILQHGQAEAEVRGGTF